MKSDNPEKNFDRFARHYDLMIDWTKRLANEAPFFRELFSRHDVSRVLDVGCGPGHHTAMFHSWGLDAMGMDISPEMIRLAGERFGTEDRLQWKVQSIEHPLDTNRFDAVVCIGNTLALHEGDSLDPVMSNLIKSLRPGGLCIIQVLNLWRLQNGPLVWQKCRRLSLDGKDHIILKGIHRVESTAYINLATITLDAGTAHADYHQTAFLGIQPDSLRAAALKLGAAECELWGSYQKEPYQADLSQDLILVCKRA